MYLIIHSNFFVRARSITAFKEYTYESNNSIESRVAISLQRLGTRNILYTIGEVYVIDGSHISILAPIIKGEDYYC